MVFSPFSRLTSFNRLASNVPLRTSSHHVQMLRVFAFLWANTLALGSCLCDNRSKTRQRQAVVLLSIPPYKPPRKPCVLCVLCVSASLFRTFKACYRTQSDWKSLLHTTSILSVSPFSGKSHYVCSVFRRRL